MAPLLTQLGTAPVMLSLLYGAAFLHALGKLRMLHGQSGSLDTKKLFAMSVLLSCLTRTMGFVTIGALNMQSVGLKDERYSAPSWRDDPEERFYEKTMMVLFDLPDFMIISAYTLLAVVWAEAFFQSRRHWLSARVYKRQLLLGYMIFNAALYAGQLVLYSLLFLPSFSQSGVLGAIYLFVTSVNLLLPLLLAVLLSYLTCTFSGFPYKSEVARIRMDKVGRVILLWTAARVVWGVSALTAVLKYEQLVGSATSLREEVYATLVVALFLATELYPFMAALDSEVLLAMSAGNVERGGGGSSSGGVGFGGDGDGDGNGDGDGAGAEIVPTSGGGGGSGGSSGGSQGRRESGPSVGPSSIRGDPGRRNRASRHSSLVSTLNAAGEGNPRQPLLPRKGDRWSSPKSASDLQQPMNLS